MISENGGAPGSVRSEVVIDPAVVQARAVRLAAGLVAPLAVVIKRTVVYVAFSAGATLIVGLVTREPLIGTAVGLDLLLVASLIVWWPFTDPTFAGAIELFNDHNCHEQAEWKAETGTSMPGSLKAAKQWLLAHPTSPGRASLLLPLGRLQEADREIDAMEPTTPEESFGIEILRQSRCLLAGDVPDLAPLHESWRSLPDVRERRHRRECLALLDAQVAVDQGRDPLVAMAAARREIDGVHWTMRTPWLLAKWFVVAMLLVVGATLIATGLVG